MRIMDLAISDTAGLLALITGEREACQRQVASMQKECPYVNYLCSPGLICDGKTQRDKAKESGFGLKCRCQAVHHECFFPQWLGCREWHYSLYIMDRLRISAFLQELLENNAN